VFSGAALAATGVTQRFRTDDVLVTWRMDEAEEAEEAS